MKLACKMHILLNILKLSEILFNLKKKLYENLQLVHVLHDNDLEMENDLHNRFISPNVLIFDGSAFNVKAKGTFHIYKHYLLMVVASNDLC